MKALEIRELPTEEITHELADKRRALFNLRFQRETEQLERPAELRRLRKDVARLLTILRERKLAEGDRAASPEAVEERAQKP